MPTRGESRGARRLARVLAMAATLNTQQAQAIAEQRRAETSQSAEEPRVAEESRPSPLELPKKSYAQAAQMARQQQLEKRMLETAETLGKGQVVPRAEPPAALPEEAEPPIAPPAGEQETVEETPPDAQIAALLAKQQKEAGRQKQAGAAQEIASQESKKGLAQLLKNQVRALRTSPSLTVVGILLTILILNVQLINTLFFHNEWVPKLDLWEIGITILLDLLILAACIVLIVVSLGPIALIMELIG